MFARFVRRPLWQIVLGMLLPIAIWDVTGSFGELRLLAAPSETRWTAPLSTDDELKTIGSTTFAPVVQKVMPSVVSIYSSRQVTSENRNREWLNDPLFRRFLGDEWLGGQTLIPRDRQTRSMGSGVIISPDGYIATNHHVVEASTDIKVLLSDRREFAARLVGTDSKTDLAVLKIEQTGLPALTFADSSKVQVGDVVLALGNPSDRVDGYRECHRPRPGRRKL
jgi:S1-C subfamily serine protease